MTFSLLRGVTLCVGFVERLTEHISDLSLYFVALTGEGFWTSSRAVFKIFRRNMLLSFTADALAQFIFTVTTVAVAGLTGLFSYIFASHILKNTHGWVSAMLFSLLTWYVLRLFTGIFSDT